LTSSTNTLLVIAWMDWDGLMPVTLMDASYFDGWIGASYFSGTFLARNLQIITTIVVPFKEVYLGKTY